MAQEYTATGITTACSSAEAEDWLAMELEEQNGARSAVIAWCHAHPRPILAAATIVVWSLLLAALIFG